MDNHYCSVGGGGKTGPVLSLSISMCLFVSVPSSLENFVTYRRFSSISISTTNNPHVLQNQGSRPQETKLKYLDGQQPKSCLKTLSTLFFQSASNVGAPKMRDKHKKIMCTTKYIEYTWKANNNVWQLIWNVLIPDGSRTLQD